PAPRYLIPGPAPRPLTLETRGNGRGRASQWTPSGAGAIIRPMSSDATVDRGGAGRLTPYELVFGPGGFETRAFPRILAEIELRGADVSAPERFLRLESVTALLRELAGDAPGVDVYGRYGALLYHAWHFWRFERRVFAVEEMLVRRLVE